MIKHEELTRSRGVRKPRISILDSKTARYLPSLELLFQRSCKWLLQAIAVLGLHVITGVSSQATIDDPASDGSNSQFHLWAMSDPHVFSDLFLRMKELKRLNPKGDLLPHESGRIPRLDARESLGSAIVHSESDERFAWDIAICAGDFSGSHGLPTEREGSEVVKQFSRLRKHKREDIYTICGNHDASPGNEWFRKWIDPLGEHSASSGVDNASRPYPIEGTWERYSFRVGNILFLMMSDRNDFAPPVGSLQDGGATGGHPPGAVTMKTFAWWKQKVLSEPEESIIVTVHHHMLKETTVGSGEWEGYPDRDPFPMGVGNRRYHGYMPEDGKHNKGAGYLYWLVDDTKRPVESIADAQAFEGFLENHPGAIDLWIGGHTHTDPEDRKNGRSQIEVKWGVNFVNVAALSMHHGGDHSEPLSRLLSFTDGSSEVRVQCYLHTDRFAERGWYDRGERTLLLGSPFNSAGPRSAIE